MSGLTQRNPQHTSTPSPVIYPPSGPSSGRASPYPAPNASSSVLRPPSAASYRAQLLGDRPGSSASQYSESPFGGQYPHSNGGSASIVEGQNDDRLEGLLGKVKILKDVSWRYWSS